MRMLNNSTARRQGQETGNIVASIIICRNLPQVPGSVALWDPMPCRPHSSHLLVRAADQQLIGWTGVQLEQPEEIPGAPSRPLVNIAFFGGLLDTGEA